jgi:hypothetical protein
MNDWLVVGVLGILFLIFIHLGRAHSPDFPFALNDQAVLGSHSQRN